jgi:hypothetical protein
MRIRSFLALALIGLGLILPFAALAQDNYEIQVYGSDLVRRRPAHQPC